MPTIVDKRTSIEVRKKRPQSAIGKFALQMYQEYKLVLLNV